MKARWIALRARIDALSSRERVMAFCAGAAVIVFMLYGVVLGPLNKRQDALKAQIAQHQNNIAGIDAEVITLVQGYNVDPDKDSRAHLAALQADTAALGASLRAMQHGLIEPERVAPLLETMLKANGRLKLVGLSSLPVTVLNGAAPAAPAAAPAPTLPAGAPPQLAALAAPPVPAAPSPAAAAPSVPAPPLALLYRHGVEVTVRGNYLDMVDYLATLEAMPARLLWGKAELTVEDYPNSRLTLTVYTLSLDQKWMKL